MLFIFYTCSFYIEYCIDFETFLLLLQQNNYVNCCNMKSKLPINDGVIITMFTIMPLMKLTYCFMCKYAVFLYILI